MRLNSIEEIRARRAELRSILEANEPETNLDEIETELRQLAEAEADLERRTSILNGLNNGTVADKPIATARTANTPTVEEPIQSRAEYRSAWLNNIRRLPLSDAENRAITTASGSASSVVPTVTQNKIIEKLKQLCPLLDKIELLHVPGGVKVPAEGTTAEAQSHKEGTTIKASDDTFDKVELSGYEVTKLVSISKSVEKMSIDAFEAWLVAKLASLIAHKIEALIYDGSGTGEAKGFNKLEWNGSNSVEVGSSASVTEGDIVKLVGLLAGGYDDGAEWYMSKRTFYTDIYPLYNKSKNNIVTCENGVYRVMGYLVNMDERFTEHEAILGNLKRGYLGNLAEDVTVNSDFDIKNNAFDFLGSAIFDGKVQAVEGFVKLKKAIA